MDQVAWVEISELGNVTLSDEDENEDEMALVHGELYLNIHSTDNPGGEIRGQILQAGSLGEGPAVMKGSGQ